MRVPLAGAEVRTERASKATADLVGAIAQLNEAHNALSTALGRVEAVRDFRVQVALRRIVSGLTALEVRSAALGRELAALGRQAEGAAAVELPEPHEGELASAYLARIRRAVRFTRAAA